LTVREVTNTLRLGQADLIVLSACQSNMDDVSKGDEVVGLTRAFIFDGTPSVIATLWSVDDRATGLLMEQFYTRLGPGAGKAAALQKAQQATRKSYPHPAYPQRRGPHWRPHGVGHDPPVSRAPPPHLRCGPDRRGPRADAGRSTLAHNGGLFLEAWPEFRRHVLVVLRQPLEEGVLYLQSHGRPRS